jgi:hypothetical protein
VNETTTGFWITSAGYTPAYTGLPRRGTMLYTLLVLLLIIVLAIVIWRFVAGRTV